jgi:hypothetical protein
MASVRISEAVSEKFNVAAVLRKKFFTKIKDNCNNKNNNIGLAVRQEINYVEK